MYSVLSKLQSLLGNLARMTMYHQDKFRLNLILTEHIKTHIIKDVLVVINPHLC